jgi:hypothetical protein
MTTVDPVPADAALSDIDAIPCRVWRPCFNRFSGLMLSAVAAMSACSSLPMLPAAATASEEAAMPHPLVPFSTIVDHWDHHWFLWLPHHPVYEAVEIAGREPDHDGRVAVWVWFTERAGVKRQIHYRNDPQLASFVGGSYRPIDYTISGDVGRPRSVRVRFDDIEDRPIDIEVSFDPIQMLSRQGAGLTDQSGHMSDRAFLIFYRDTNALAQDAYVSIAGKNMTFDRNDAKGAFPFKWAYSHDITIGLVQYGSFKVAFGPGGYSRSPGTGGYVLQRSWGSSVSLLADSSGRLTEYINRAVGGDFLRVAFDPPLPPCGSKTKPESSAFSISIAAATDIVKGHVEVSCGDDREVLAWHPDQPIWASKQPFRSEISRPDEHSVLLAVLPAPSAQ